ncbi:L,D-transpeptidase [Pelagibacterium flavum]|uniref:L,D-transpeptidase n=1 Tax=Pelagibacterium flavum TaxID=2984530 RepID=A0ABY6ITL8_9HYPH|nr:L,D-transpeptidase [Pelagibacterium sp. YIM 151497]UYQ73982.1 L,D-transpeptidase [Pelagibacterium sp. YIM 151497]|tara:strand:- start:3199 stop:3828 length:630 start_codon:yes stop_codon:yes gene_type:complete
MSLTRRGFLVGLPLFLAACSTRTTSSSISMVSAYGPVADEPFPLAALNARLIKPELRRQVVDYETNYSKGTIVVDTPNRFLYLVQEDGKAMRYGVGVGREGLALRGNAYIGRKAEWPSWTPTANMLRRDPEANGPYRNGMPGGPNNPLGARALYLYRNGGDTMFRIHGTNQPQSIGLAMSSGCIRMLNHDIIDLYERVPSGTRVVVVQA